jgi:hypothetical protein
MSQNIALSAASVSHTAEAVSTTPVATTKDLGRVKLGGASIRFDGAASTKNSGKVRLGGASIKF